MAIRIVIADDHELIRKGIISLLDGADVDFVAEADCGKQAIEAVKRHEPDIVLLDIRMPEGDGFTVLSELRQAAAKTQIIVLSTYENPTYIARAQTMGAADYVLKGADRDTLLNTIRAVHAGQIPTPYGELHKVAGTMAERAKSSDPELTLTQRETQVLRHLALGLSNKEIAQSLSISVETVKEHVQHLLRKLGAVDRTQAAVWAVKQGIVE